MRTAAIRSRRCGRPTYDISAELAGFRTVRQTDVVLAANQNLTLNITLELGELSETVTVAGEAASVDISSSTIAEVVDSKRIVELPLNGRDAARSACSSRAWCVTSVDQESGKTIPGALRLSTNGTESRQASFRLDGTNHTDSYFQQNQPFPFPDALQEFIIQTSNYSAAQGTSAGAVVNAVTRSGTNNLHGGVFGYVRDRTFNSKNYFSAERDFLKRKQYGGYAGGPILPQQDVLLRRLAGHDDPEHRRHAEPDHRRQRRCAAAISARCRCSSWIPSRGCRFPATRFPSAGSIRPR